jgi:hypothetical protein
MGTDTIAEYLNIEVADIREVRPFQYVYFVIFNIRRRPTFVSKREIAKGDYIRYNGKNINLIENGAAMAIAF